jgi:hypothetical protein
MFQFSHSPTELYRCSNLSDLEQLLHLHCDQSTISRDFEFSSSTRIQLSPAVNCPEGSKNVYLCAHIGPVSVVF